MDVISDDKRCTKLKDNMKTDKDGKDMRGVTVNRFAEGKNICIETDKVRNFTKIQYLRKYACDSSCKSFNVKNARLCFCGKPNKSC